MPKYSIDNLVRKMDSDNDGKVTLDDIKKFSEKNFIYLPDEVHAASVLGGSTQKRRFTLVWLCQMRRGGGS